MSKSAFTLIAKFGLTLVTGAFIARGIGFLHRWWGMHALSIEQYADFALIAGLFYALVPVAGFGLTPAIARLLANRQQGAQHEIQIYRSGLAIGFVAGIISWLLFIILFPSLNHPHSSFGLGIAAFMGFIGFAVMQSRMGIELGKRNVLGVAIWEASEAVSRVIILVLFFAVGVYLNWITLFWSVALAAPLTALLLSIPNFGVIRLKQNLKNSFSNTIEIGKKLLPHALSVVIVSFSVLILAYILRLYAKEGGIEEVAYLDAALVFYGVPRLIFSSLVRPLIPLAAASNKHDEFILGRWMSVLIVFIPIPIGVAIAATELGGSIFALLSLSEYQPAAIVLGLLVGASGVDFLFGYISNYLQGINRAPGLALICIVCIGPILLSIWYFKEEGSALAAAIIFISYYILLTILAAIYLKSVSATRKKSGLNDRMYR